MPRPGADPFLFAAPAALAAWLFTFAGYLQAVADLFRRPNHLQGGAA